MKVLAGVVARISITGPGAKTQFFRGMGHKRYSDMKYSKYSGIMVPK